MKAPQNARMHAVAFLYDHISDFPVWFRRLTPGQLEQIASVMVAWHASVGESSEVAPLGEVEKRAITRAVNLCGGDIIKAAKLLQIGKTTLYRKLKRWGYSTSDRILIYQASALTQLPLGQGQQCRDAPVGTPQESASNIKDRDDGRRARNAL